MGESVSIPDRSPNGLNRRWIRRFLDGLWLPATGGAHLPRVRSLFPCSSLPPPLAARPPVACPQPNRDPVSPEGLHPSGPALPQAAAKPRGGRQPCRPQPYRPQPCRPQPCQPQSCGPQPCLGRQRLPSRGGAAATTATATATTDRQRGTGEGEGEGEGVRASGAAHHSGAFAPLAPPAPHDAVWERQPAEARHHAHGWHALHVAEQSLLRGPAPVGGRHRHVQRLRVAAVHGVEGWGSARG